MSFKLLQEKTDKLIQNLGGYWPPFAMLASVVEEVGELAREINSLEKIKIKKPTEIKKPLGEEISDTIFSLICIANYYNINLDTEFTQMLKKYESRDKNRFAKTGD
jgi:NTP pyrophosphatase (non-canonical NTP hydrolase)